MGSDDINNKKQHHEGKKYFPIFIAVGTSIGSAFGLGLFTAMRQIWFLPIGISFGILLGVFAGLIFIKRK